MATIALQRRRTVRLVLQLIALAVFIAASFIVRAHDVKSDRVSTVNVTPNLTP